MLRAAAATARALSVLGAVTPKLHPLQKYRFNSMNIVGLRHSPSVCAQRSAGNGSCLHTGAAAAPAASTACLPLVSRGGIASTSGRHSHEYWPSAWGSTHVRHAAAAAAAVSVANVGCCPLPTPNTPSRPTAATATAAVVTTGLARKLSPTHAPPYWRRCGCSGTAAACRP